MNGWSNRSKAKKAYLRRHGVRSDGTSPERGAPSPQRSEGLRYGGGLASISEQLFELVTSYHAQIGSSVSPSALLALEASLLDEAEVTASAGEWDAALNIFTPALAVTEKVRAAGDTAAQASTQAAIVMHIGSCLHHVGELEAAKAYYEEAIASIRRIRTPTYERWFTSALGRVSGVPPPDLQLVRTQFIRARLHDIAFERKPECEYLGECGPSRWTGIARRMRARAPEAEPHDDDYDDDCDEDNACGSRDGYGDYGYGDGGNHGSYGANYGVRANGYPQGTPCGGGAAPTAHRPDLGSARMARSGAVAIPPPTSSRTAALMAAGKRVQPGAQTQLTAGASSMAAAEAVGDELAADQAEYLDEDMQLGAEEDAEAAHEEADMEPDWLREAGEALEVESRPAAARLIDIEP